MQEKSSEKIAVTPGKEKPEDLARPSQKELGVIGTTYQNFFTWRTYRSGFIRQLEFSSLDDFLTKSRTLFWNTTQMSSEDLAAIGINVNIPFIRKEVMDFLGRMTQLNIKPHIIGDALDAYGIKVLNSLYQKWRMKSNDKVEKFWQILYAIINGTVCTYIGYKNPEKVQRFLTEVDDTNNIYKIVEKTIEYWDDVCTEIVPLEDIYLSKLYQRNIQKQGKLIWRSQMDIDDFHLEFGKYPDHVFVLPGNRIAEDSLYYRLLGGTGIITSNKIEVLREYDTDNDRLRIVANGIWLNKIGKGEEAQDEPIPFTHKMMPFTWGIFEPIDEKFAYGMSMPFKIKDPSKIMNMSYMMLLERELRTIDKPILSSDLEAPQIIFGQKKVIPVQDVEAYKEINLAPASGDYFTTMNSFQSMMSTLAQGGMNQAVPSIQPKSAAEVDQINQAKQQAMGSSVLLYYDMVRQEILLVLKTMLQFYTAKKFAPERGNIVKSLLVPNMPQTKGGVGHVEVRIVKEHSDPMNLYFEAVRKSIDNGKETEILEASVDFIENLEFDIEKIELETDNNSNTDKAMYVQTFLQPLLQMWGQSGLVDPAKTLISFLEKFGEHPADYVSDQAMPNVLNAWKSQNMVPMQPPKGINRDSVAGQSVQSPTGQGNGAMSNGGAGMTPQTQNAPQAPQVPVQ